ncbi:MAG: hypothetical protein H6R16_2945 [Proteobacteria bacterium]|nr:hypothetical protein [Pseudomonadota bacterium]
MLADWKRDEPEWGVVPGDRNRGTEQLKRNRFLHAVTPITVLTN